ncbi:MAG TPA: TrbG/VirB9 family P-type conjugative transfer protein [Acetobacteraceae bacterium]|nr:TrbG/VirB9 family P-type conjugative transfer protein [Acetobacteraceae bacterium]
MRKLLLAGSAALALAVSTTALAAADPGKPSTPAGPNHASSAQEWNNLVKAPPSAREQFQTRRQAIKALVTAKQAGTISSLPPIAGSDGSILYPYGESWPTVVSSPLHFAVIELAPGDKPSQVVVGEPGEWRITQAMAGNRPILAVSPRFAGLHTNLMITAVSAGGESRVYYLNLVSDNANYVPKVGFYFPSQMQTAWNQAATDAADSTVATLPGLTAKDLDFNWKIRCGGGGWFSDSDCRAIKPTRVFDDGTHTYIQVPGNLANTSGLPTVLATNSAGQPALINFRVKNGYYVLDGVPAQIKLIAGVGSHGRVAVLTRER